MPAVHTAWMPRLRWIRAAPSEGFLDWNPEHLHVSSTVPSRFTSNRALSQRAAARTDIEGIELLLARPGRKSEISSQIRDRPDLSMLLFLSTVGNNMHYISVRGRGLAFYSMPPESFLGRSNCVAHPFAVKYAKERSNNSFSQGASTLKGHKSWDSVLPSDDPRSISRDTLPVVCIRESLSYFLDSHKYRYYQGSFI